MNCSRPTRNGVCVNTLNLRFFRENLIDLSEQIVIAWFGDDLVASFIIQDEDVVVRIVLHAGNK